MRVASAWLGFCYHDRRNPLVRQRLAERLGRGQERGELVCPCARVCPLVEVFADGFSLNGRLLLADGRPFAEVYVGTPALALEASDEQGREYGHALELHPLRREPTFPGSHQWCFAPAFTRPLDPAARELRVAARASGWRLVGVSWVADVQPGPWSFAIALPSTGDGER